MSRKYTVELEVWPDGVLDDPYMDIVEALDAYLPYNHVYTIIDHGEYDASTNGD